MSRLAKISLMLTFSFILTIGCAARYNKISSCPTNEQSSFFKEGRQVVVSRQGNSLITIAPYEEAFPVDTRPSFIITVNNLSNQPITFSTENVAFNMDGKDLEVFSYQELVQEIEQQRRSAATTQALIGALGVLGASMDGGRTYNAGTYQTQNTVGTYSGTSYSPLATLQAQTAFSSMASNNIAAINSAAEEQLNGVQNTVLRKETVLPNHWYGGYVRIANLAEPEKPKSIGAMITFGKDVHQFMFILTQDGQTIQKTQRTKGESVSDGSASTSKRSESQEEKNASNDTNEQEKRWAENFEKNKKSAENGDPEAQFQLGSNYSSGIGVAQDHNEAVKWWRKAAEQGHLGAQFGLGEMLSEGKGVPKNLKEAVKWYEKAAEQGHPFAQVALVRMYKRGEDVEKNYDLAEKWALKLEDQNPKIADLMSLTTGDLFYSIAYKYSTGKGEPLDYAEAKYWYERAAAQGHLIAYCSLGMMYYKGEGVEKNYAIAMDWLHKAAEKKFAYAYSLLGIMYYDGIATEKNHKQAAEWFKKAAEADIGEAQFRLAGMYLAGDGVAVNYNEAAKLFQKVAEAPESSLVTKGQRAASQAMLGMIYAEGLGIDKDYREARKWYIRAAEQGDEFAHRSLLKILENDLFQGWKWITYNEEVGIVLINPDKLRREGALTWFWQLILPYENSNLNVDHTMALYVADCVKQESGLVSYYEYGSNGNVLNYSSKKETEIIIEPVIPGSIGDSALKYVCSETRERPSGRTTPLESSVSYGTGWPVAGGYVITNNHVISDHKNISLIRTDGTRISAQVALRDKSNDLALLQPENVKLLPPALPLSSIPVKTGATVLTMGYPHPDILGSKPKLTEGIVSATTGARDDPRVLQISVPLQAGNSGGPLINMEGEVVGIVMGKLDDIKMLKWTGDLPQNVNYAIKVSYLTGLLSSAPVNHRLAPLNMKMATSIEGIAAQISGSILLVVAE